MNFSVEQAYYLMGIAYAIQQVISLWINKDEAGESIEKIKEITRWLRDKYGIPSAALVLPCSLLVIIISIVAWPSVITFDMLSNRNKPSK